MQKRSEAKKIYDKKKAELLLGLTPQKYVLKTSSKTLDEAIRHYLKFNEGKDKTTLNEYERFFKLFNKTFPFPLPAA